ncbi:MAG: hypothetical protein ACTHKQ_20290, partial [Mesorhizobium sp.]
TSAPMPSARSPGQKPETASPSSWSPNLIGPATYGPSYAECTAKGARARVCGPIDTSGDDLIRKARRLVVREITDGHWV